MYILSRNVELHEYIRFIKEEVTKSEDPKPKKGFWIGAQSLEITFQVFTEVDKEGGISMYFLSAKGQKKEKLVQTVTITLVTQDFRLKKPMEVGTSKVRW